MSDRIACPACGSPNALDDLFCGTCGSALTSALSPKPPTEPVAVPPLAHPSQPPTPARSPALASPGVVACRACGTANPTERAFCQRCGEELPAATATRPLPAAGRTALPSGLDPTAGPGAGAGTGTGGSGRRPLLLGGSLVAGAFIILAGIVVAMGFLGGSDSGPRTGQASPDASADGSPDASPAASPALTGLPSEPPEPTPPPATPTPTPTPRPTPTPTPRPPATPTPASGSLARRALEDDLLARASFLSCGRFRQSDQPFDHGARAAIWCGSPSARVRQAALFTFPSVSATDSFWLVRMASIEPTPADTPGACEAGAAGQTRWGFGALACYVDGGVARLRWSDDRTAMYGVLDATDGDVAALYAWWRTNGRRLGRPLTAASAPTPTPTSVGAGPILGAPSSFVCGEAGPTLSDALDRRWRMTRVTFRTFSTYERVILHLERTGPGGPGYAPTARVEAIPAADVPLEAPQLEAPRAGSTAFVVRLGTGVADAVRLSHYAPNGMRTVTELSTYRLPDGSSAAVIGSSGEPCFQLRIPQWRPGATGNQALADITIDVQR